ncbi:MAG: hypothetical protein VX269_01495 [Verrucomicrobiota bacterium]|nr:hypothetical protein [Verrucomicrobiota bacterium]|tara:strand:+ start:227 stop:481 length:255 start_codon:yes stop_codon:yes gene_type:complete
MNVPKVRMTAVLIGSIMPPQRASAAKGEILASASAVGCPKYAGTTRTTTNRTKTEKINVMRLNIIILEKYLIFCSPLESIIGFI